MFRSIYIGLFCSLDKIVDCPPDKKIILVERDFKMDEIELVKDEKG